MVWRRFVRRRRRGGRSHEASPRRHRFRSTPKIARSNCPTRSSGASSREPSLPSCAIAPRARYRPPCYRIFVNRFGGRSMTGLPDDGAKPDEPFTGFVKRDPRACQAIEIHKIHVTIFDDEFARRLRTASLRCRRSPIACGRRPRPARRRYRCSNCSGSEASSPPKAAGATTQTCLECSGIEVEHDAGTIAFPHRGRDHAQGRDPLHRLTPARPTFPAPKNAGEF